MRGLRLTDLFDLTHTLAGEYLAGFVYPWQALGGIAAFVRALGAGLGGQFCEVSPQVYVHAGATVAPTAYLGAPCIVCAGAQVRHGAFVRGSALIGADCVVGNSTEVKNAILFDGVQVPHFNYVGDSILGYRAHMGAGSIASNVRADRAPVSVHCGNVRVRTGLTKCGAMIGDGAEIGCNCVLNPGTVIGRHAAVYPLSSVRGYVPARAVCQNAAAFASPRDQTNVGKEKDDEQ